MKTKITISLLILVVVTLTGCGWLSNPGNIQIVGEQAEAPVFNPSPGFFDMDSIILSLSSATPDAQILYTLDGSLPIDYDLWFSSLEQLDQQVSQSPECFTIFNSLNETVFNETVGNNTQSWQYHIGGLIAVGILTEQTVMECQEVIMLFDPNNPSDPNNLIYNTNAVDSCMTVFNAMESVITQDFEAWFNQIGNMSNETVSACSSIFEDWMETVSAQQGSAEYTAPLNITQNITIKAVANKDGYFPSDLVEGTFLLSGYVPPVNQPPLVYAGVDESLLVSETLNLAGVATDDGLPNPPGTIASEWIKVSGPGNVAFGNSYSLSTTATFSEAGTYTLRLTASDSELESYDNINVVVLEPNATNLPPFVVITSPANGDSFEFSTRLKIRVRTLYGDEDGFVTTTKYYNNGVLFDENTRGFGFLNAPPLGNHTLTVEAIDDDGASTMSDPVFISVVESTGGGGGKGKNK